MPKVNFSFSKVLIFNECCLLEVNINVKSGRLIFTLFDGNNVNCVGDFLKMGTRWGVWWRRKKIEKNNYWRMGILGSQYFSFAQPHFFPVFHKTSV